MEAEMPQVASSQRRFSAALRLEQCLEDTKCQGREGAQISPKQGLIKGLRAYSLPLPSLPPGPHESGRLLKGTPPSSFGSIKVTKSPRKW